MDSKIYSTIAKYYDPIYNQKSELNDLPFYLEKAQQHGGPILEIACGTGRILLEIAKLGINIDGVDCSTDMLSILQEKLQKQSPAIQQRVNLHEGDMRKFSLGKQYKLVLIPFRPMQHMYTIEDQISALNRAKEHLQPKGFLIFDVFYPNFKILDEEMNKEELDTEWIDSTSPQKIIRRYFVRNSVNKLQQYFEGEFIFRTFGANKLVKEERCPLKMNYYTYPHLLLLFKLCELKIVEEYGSFTKDPIDICKEMIFVLRR